jgi:segregation and condensation protein B
MFNLENKIEAILFFKGEAVSIKQLGVLLSVEKQEIIVALESLKQNLQNRGLRLIKNEDKVMLGTAPEIFDLIEGLRKDELSKDLGKAGLETLSIILYKGPITRSEIDYIRGVNSSSILRNLLVRGLVERKTNEKNQRIFLYSPTFELLQFLGITNLEELPEFNEIKEEFLKKEKDESGKETEDIEESEDNN